MITLIPQPVTPETFAPFGTVTSLPKSGDIHDLLVAFQAEQDAITPVLRLVRVASSVGVIAIEQLERHPFSNQTFLALDQSPALIIVCDSDTDGNPDPDTVQAFTARADQIITYASNVWHHRLTALGGDGAFAMVMRQTGRDDDTALFSLPSKLVVKPD